MPLYVTVTKTSPHPRVIAITTVTATTTTIVIMIIIVSAFPFLYRGGMEMVEGGRPPPPSDGGQLKFIDVGFITLARYCMQGQEADIPKNISRTKLRI